MSTADRVRGMISRAVVGLVNDAFKLQGLQVTIMADQTPDDVERFQSYGLTSVPHPGAEGIALAIGGSTGHTVMISVDDRRFRLTGLQDGEVALYDDLGHKVHLTRDGIVLDGAGQDIRLINTPTVRVEADFHVTGEITAVGDVTGAGISLATHKHGGVMAGAAETGMPV